MQLGCSDHANKKYIRAFRPWTALCFGLLALWLSFSLAGGRAYAQSTTAEVLGSVHDETGSIIPGAEVTITNKGTNESRKTTSNENGAFTFNLLQPGTYRLSVTSANFKRYEVPNITLAAGDQPRIDAGMSVGGVNETVSVEATSPLLQSESSTMQSSVNQLAVQDLPLNGRNFVQLVQLAPGANEGPPSSLTAGHGKDDERGAASVSANGQSDLLNNQLIDGMDNNEGLIGTVGVRPSVEAVSEIRVQTNVYSADTGRTAGAAVNVITKSGTNQFHGSAYEYFRNDIFNTYPFQFGAHNAKQRLRQNQFGASIGGPIFKNKTFFFGDYEGFRLVSDANPSISTVPTLFEEQNPGNLTDIGLGIIPQDQIDPAARNYLALYPAPNLPNVGGQGRFVGVSRMTQSSNNFDVRLDHSFNDHNVIFGRYSHNQYVTWQPSTFPVKTVAGLNIQPSGTGYSPSNDHNVSLSFTHTFTQNLLLQLQAGFLRVDNESYPAPFGNGNKVGPAVNTAYGQPGVNISGFTSGLAPITIQGGYTGLGAGAFSPLTDLTNAFQYQGTVTYTRGAHNIKMGASLIRRQLFSVQSHQQLPNWTFTNLAQFEQGTYISTTRSYSTTNPHYRLWEPSVYFQDDWHITANTTLNLGLRYDVFTPYTEVNNAISTWNPATESIQVAGQNGISSTAGIRTFYGSVAPRFGFSSTVRPGLVVRGGIGIAFFPTSLTSNVSLKNQPFLNTYGPFSSTTAPAGFSKFINGAPAATVNSASNPTGSMSAAVDPNFRPAMATQMNLAVQKDFSGNVVTVAYVGVLTQHIAQPMNDLNAPPPNTVGLTINGVACNAATDPHQCNPNQLRPTYSKYPGLTTIGWYASGGSGSYHSLQLSFQRRLTKGLSFNANYTYARDLDNATGLSNETVGGYAIVPSITNTYDYGNSDLDLRSRGAATVNYQLPFGNNLHGISGLVVKGWQINSIGVWGSGQPFTVFNAGNVSNTNPGGSTDRANRVGTWQISNPGVSRFFNTAAFASQAPGTLGLEHRNDLHGPHFRHVDLSFIKNFPIHEDTHFEFRAEGFNITNTANFANPTATLGSSTFGQLTSMSASYAPRVIQFALKLVF
ncbi:MAG TPA: carboxypeptidase regulatory-like domain-containing protein [Granulicella sp.]